MKSLGKIYLVDDDELILSMLGRSLEKAGYEVRSESSGVGIVEKIRSWHPDVTLLDINLPGQSGMDTLQELKNTTLDMEVIMLTADDTAETAVKAMKTGAWDYLTKPFNMDEVKIVVGNAIKNIKLTKELEYLRKVSSSLFEEDFLGTSNARRVLKERVEKMAEAHVASILITGESGVGKEVIARNIHQMMHSAASGNSVPFIAVNCSALPDTLLESELFGYEKGSFTDAKGSKKGLFEVADGGTLLLDEIGEMKMTLQSKLLRVLEERAVRRIGAQEEIGVEVTVIATTNRNLKDAVEKGDFRTDLYYRLNAFSLYVPPLRERTEDILILARHFLATFSKEYSKTIEGFSREAEELLERYQWPGNVRELKNMVRGLGVLQNTQVILPEHLPVEISGWATKKPSEKGGGFILPEGGISLEEFEKDLIIQAMERVNHNKTRAAKLLQVSYDSFRYQLKKFGLE